MTSASPSRKREIAHALRPYQRDCIASILAAYKQGRRRLLVSLPTGTGITVVFVSFVRAFHMKKKLLVLAHRDELLEQARDKLVQHAPEASVTTEQGHAVAASYRRILDHFGPFEANNPRLLVGFTATPRRGDGQALGSVFEEITFSRGIEEMVRERWLCDVSGLRVKTDVDLDNVRVRRGEFVEAELSRAVNIDARNEIVLDAYRRYASGRPAIVFCVDVAHAKAVAETFARAGLKSRAVWGEMTREDRRAALDEFRDGTTAVLTNCNLLAEGFDEPKVSCVIMARPTKSRLLYAQMIGRGTRPHDSKPNLLVIDVADNSREHSLAGIHHVFDLPDDFDLAGSDAIRAADALRKIGTAWPWIDVDRIASAADVRLLEDAHDGVASACQAVAERFWLFAFDPPDALRDLTDFSWHAAPGGDFALDVGTERLLITKTLLDQWTLMRLGPGRRELLHGAASLDAVIAFADRWVEKERPDKLELVSEHAGWRWLPPSDKQLAVLRRARLPIPNGLTRGQASRMISHLSARERTAGVNAR